MHANGSIAAASSTASGERATDHNIRGIFSLVDFFAVASGVVHLAAAGDHSREIKLLAYDGDKRLNELVRNELGESRKCERHHYEANSMLSWFLREGTDVAAFVTASHSDHSYGTIFEALLQQAPATHHLRVVQSYMEWITMRRGGELSQLVMEEDPVTHVEVWRWPTGEVLDEIELRGKLSQMHQAFLSSRLGDVQEELALAKALAASTQEPSHGGSRHVDEAWARREREEMAANDRALEARREHERKERLAMLQKRDPKKTKLGRKGSRAKQKKSKS